MYQMINVLAAQQIEHINFGNKTGNHYAWISLSKAPLLTCHCHTMFLNNVQSSERQERGCRISWYIWSMYVTLFARALVSLSKVWWFWYLLDHHSSRTIVRPPISETIQTQQATCRLLVDSQPSKTIATRVIGTHKLLGYTSTIASIRRGIALIWADLKA